MATQTIPPNEWDTIRPGDVVTFRWDNGQREHRTSVEQVVPTDFTRRGVRVVFDTNHASGRTSIRNLVSIHGRMAERQTFAGEGDTEPDRGAVWRSANDELIVWFNPAMDRWEFTYMEWLDVEPGYMTTWEGWRRMFDPAAYPFREVRDDWNKITPATRPAGALTPDQWHTLRHGDRIEIHWDGRTHTTTVERVTREPSRDREAGHPVVSVRLVDTWRGQDNPLGRDRYALTSYMHPNRYIVKVGAAEEVQEAPKTTTGRYADVAEARRAVLAFALSEYRSKNNCEEGTREFLTALTLPNRLDHAEHILADRQRREADAFMAKVRQEVLNAVDRGDLSRTKADRYLTEFGLETLPGPTRVQPVTAMLVRPDGNAVTEAELSRVLASAGYQIRAVSAGSVIESSD